MNNPKSLTPTLTQSPQFQNTDAHILRFSLLRRVLLYSTVFFCSCRVILLALLRRVLLLAPSSALLRRVLLLASSSSLLRRIFLLAPRFSLLRYFGLSVTARLVVLSSCSSLLAVHRVSQVLLFTLFCLPFVFDLFEFADVLLLVFITADHCSAVSASSTPSLHSCATSASSVVHCRHTDYKPVPPVEGEGRGDFEEY
ncbi:uncharacterized protein DS421_3g95420 [Arachis hypogaea]|nr:uncharacterized protein DS421_3g95420 [Arachis hypogaea]